MDFTLSSYISEFYIFEINSILWESSPAVNPAVEELTFICIYIVCMGSPIPTERI